MRFTRACVALPRHTSTDHVQVLLYTAYYGTVEMGWWGVSALVGYTIFTEDQWKVGGVMHSRNLVVCQWCGETFDD